MSTKLTKRNAPPEIPQLLKAASAAQFVGVSRSLFFRLVKDSDLLKPVRIPGLKPMWRRADLQKYLDSLDALR